MPDDLRPAQRDDAAFMRLALALARRGWGQTTPNPMVGAVVVNGGEIVGEGYHARYGGDHAEVVALRAAGARAQGATLYVSLEPCAHHGKTPPCSDAVIAAGVSRVVTAVRDPDPKAAGGVERLRAAGLTVTVGLHEDEARELNAPFFNSFVSERPWIVLKLALSLDGAVADAGRTRAWLTGTASRREVHGLRAAADAVAAGIGTVLDDPLLTVRDVAPPRVPPMRVVFDSHARLPLESALVRTAGAVPTLVVARTPDADRAGALRSHGVEVLAAASLGDALGALRARGVRSMLVEGGARLAGAFLGGATVDRLIIFQAPLILGAGALNAFASVPGRMITEADRLRMVECRVLGSDIMTTYAFGAKVP
jgi:diaminohydroxyphosphoribosylaminopyrimidine deaminase/5-amino-6-(5-phosphoribosylamino)uracil reductase